MRLRLFTYNIHKCIGGVDRRYRPERIRETIAPNKPDIVFLQEVDEGTLRSKGDRQVDVLADALGFRHRVFYPNVRVRGGGHYGNAILSRFPLTEARNIDVTIPLTKARSVLHVRVRIRSRSGGRRIRTVHLFNLHLGLSQPLRRLQLRKLMDSHPISHLHPRTPVIVAGDFNDVWGTLGPRILSPAGFRTFEDTFFTFPAVAPLRALDSVYVRGDIVLERIERPTAGPVRWASDHLPLLAELRFPRPRPEVRAREAAG
jgi:endonuclease/exonuclease/phosphatase family metal-dependent hydrolase